MRTLVTDLERQQAAEMYLRGCRINCIARKLNRSQTAVHNMLVRQGIKIRVDKYNSRSTRSSAGEPGPDDPSPGEIKQATAKIRSIWGEQEEQERRDAVPYEFPVFNSRLKPI